MSFIGSMLSDSQGAGFQGQGTNIAQPATSAMGQQSLEQQQAFINALQGQNGVGNQSQVYNQMQGTQGLLNQMAQGNGPSAAQAQLTQATNQGLQQQAGALASAKGLNPAMAAQMSAQQGAQMSQGAANQAAQLRANQQLAAISALQQQQSNLGNLAGNQVGQQQGAIQNYAGNTLGQLNAQNQANVGMQSNINNANAGIANTNAQGQQKLIGGLLNSAGTGMGMPGMANGGIVSQYAEGGQITKPMSAINFLSGGKMPQSINLPMLAHGGKVPAMVSPGEIYLPPHSVDQVKAGANPLTSGEKIPGKSKVKGNSFKNDTVSKDLEVGGLVLPKSVTEAKNPTKAAHKFIDAVLAKQRMTK